MRKKKQAASLQKHLQYLSAVSRRPALKAINLPHGKIEKPKSVTSATCFDRSSLRADERFYLSDAIFPRLPLLPTGRRTARLHPFLPPRTNHILSIDSCLHEKVSSQDRFSYFLSLRAFGQPRDFSFTRSIFSSLPLSFPSPTLPGLLAPPSISLTLVIISIPNQFYRHPPTIPPCLTAVASLNYKG